MSKIPKDVIIWALKRTFPVLLGYFPLGTAFGVFVTASGLSPVLAVVTSIVIYSATNQFMTVSFLMAGAPILQIILVTLFLSARHTFYSLSLIRKFARLGLVKFCMIFMLTDETYALISSIHEEDEATKKRKYFAISAFNQVYWVAGTALGAVVGSALDLKLKGIEFVLTALFTVLTIEQYRHSKDLRPVLIGVILGVIGIIFIPKNYMLLACILSGSLILVLMRKRKCLIPTR